jgi:hypothetical protein
MSCPPLDLSQNLTPDFLLQTWTGGKGVMDDTLPIDPATGIIQNDAIQSKVQSLVASGVISSARVTPGGDVDALSAQDKALYGNLTSEFCFYEQRYMYALQQFLQAATLQQSTGGASATAQNWLGITQQLNKRTNSVLQIMTHLPTLRQGQLSDAQNYMVSMNNNLNDKLRKLQATYKMLNREDAVLLTQKEMVRYTGEKNSYTHNRIIVWTALNILALGAIFYVYRS